MKYAVLNWRDPFLSLAELRALTDTKYDQIHMMSGVAIGEWSQDTLSSRSALIKRNGDLIMVTNDPKEVNETLKGGCFSIDIDVALGEMREEFTPIYNEAIKGIKLSRTCEKLDMMFSDGNMILGKRKDSIDNRTLDAHNKKPFTQSGTMTARTSRLLVNLSAPRRTFLDPFCGLGSLLIEASWLGYRCYGLDFDLYMTWKSKENLKSFSLECQLVQGSASSLPFRQVDGIATDPPYGRSTKFTGELKSLYEEFFYSTAEILKGKLVFSTDAKMDFDDDLKSAGFSIDEIHFMYMHKSLSRKIYVVRR
ncbi:tRNA (guanine(10)-N2)-dimethyltransferase [Sulfuracidifex tepidarius]|uniref:tRNA (guanine(10)-N(2))-dimethyltransferase n=1 Tax=Sulfuracidifex tepidarius TaxID=1294262 RepID=A0A510DTT8_9CREN|nr:TRM11 family methyltransferase [Sulfuracidifex tepidarius]BBG23575.1 tRNA (guanine(10)-N2)-dimethyltransferase [Sulfuracidifex tepidarius]